MIRWVMRGSFSVEYAVMAAVIAAALVAMAVYMQRSLAGRWRTVGDTFGYGKQYQP